MSPSRIFILRPVATTLLMAAVMLAGFVAYGQLPVSALPQVDYPTIQVLTFYPGGGPSVIVSSVTAPLERQFGQVPGLKQMTSTSTFGASLIVLQFNLDQNIDVEEQQVQAAINAAGTFLPTDLPNPPIYNKVNPADAPILTLALSSETIPLQEVEDKADTTLAQKISQLPGVGLVTISGGQKPAVRVQANPTALASYGLGLEDLRTALANANQDQAKGNIDGARQAYTIGANDQIFTSAEYKPVIIGYKNGAPVRVEDVATVTDSVENTSQAAWVNDTRAVIVNIQRQPGANIISVVDRIEALLPQLKASLPPAIQITTLTDRTTTIRASVKDVQFELMLTVGLVVMVIFLFLRNLSATIIPSVAVPLSLVGTFAAMYLLGFSLDNLSLMALTISTGFVVDDAIVMIENIERYLEAGDSPLDAALKGSGQIGFTIISLTVSLIAVLIPLLFMGDIVGRLFREFAITLSVTILISAGVSLTLTPMMCSKLLKHRPLASQGWFYRVSEHGWQWVVDRYASTLRVVLRHQTFTLFVTLGTLVLTLYMYAVIPKGFFPVQDTGVILGISQAPESTSFQGMSDKQEKLARVILQDPDVVSLSSFIGVDGTNMTPNSGRIQINLKPRDERTSDVSQIIRRLSDKTQSVEGIALYMQAVQDLTVEDRVSRTQFQYSLEATDPNELATWVQRLMAKLQNLPNLRDVATDEQNHALEEDLVVDRDTASRLGLTASAIDNTLYDAFGQRLVSIMFTQINQYHVVLEVAPEFRQSPDALKNLYVDLELWAAGAPQRLHPFRARHHLPDAQSPGPVSLDHDLLQPGSRRLPGRRRSGYRKCRPRHWHAGQRGRQLSGYRRRFPQLSRQRILAAARRGGHRLHRPRSFIRKLYSSAHDSIHPSLCRRGRDSGLATLSSRPQRHCSDRHHPADRHREEKRHHDDRLRPGGGARRTSASRGGHLSGLLAALPADHDDHHGRFVRRLAAGHGTRHRVGAAPPARNQHCGRPAAQPVAYPLHHPGRLYLV